MIFPISEILLRPKQLMSSCLGYYFFWGGESSQRVVQSPLCIHPSCALNPHPLNPSPHPEQRTDSDLVMTSGSALSFLVCSLKSSHELKSFQMFFVSNVSVPHNRHCMHLILVLGCCKARKKKKRNLGLSELSR